MESVVIVEEVEEGEDGERIGLGEVGERTAKLGVGLVKEVVVDVSVVVVVVVVELGDKLVAGGDAGLGKGTEGEFGGKVEELEVSMGVAWS